ncbi:MAG: AmmeMemoRadiSam system protein B [Bacteroidales bacterium]|nr:AmmeMemoRadiSam system protein B [Bacteroidales bacterium]
MSVRIIYYCIFLLIFGQSCHSQTKETNYIKTDRQPAVAGSFYPGNSVELTKMLEGFFSEAEEADVKDPLAIIVPHAGYVFSGSTAAAAFKQIDRNKIFRHIFLIGSSHTMYFNGASVYTQGDFITPLGTVKVDTLANWLVNNNKIITNDTKPHITEHSLEVQLPFLQYWLKNDFTIIPIIIGGQSQEICRKLADALEPYFNKDNIFVISTDFSHYPNYEEAKMADAKMANAILTNSARKFILIKNQVENSNINNLATAMCGWTSVLTLINITEKLPDVSYKKIVYKNSGDSRYGDKERVVGYYAIVAAKGTSEQSESDYLNENEKIELLRIARKTLSTYLSESVIPACNKEHITGNMNSQAGAFVTLKLNDNLRGCTGNFYPDKPLYLTVQDMTVAAATQDPRFSPVSKSEAQKLEIEISVLTPLIKISSSDEFILGKHGVYIRKGPYSGTFLPQVATETGWSKEEFLGHCSRDKARIGWDGWKTAELYVYEALIFNEHEFKDKL